MKVLLVTSPNERCGIHEYGAMLTEAMRKAHPDVEFWVVGPDADTAVDLVASLADTSAAFDLVHVNHQAALHSSWMVNHIVEIRGGFCPVVVTHHDTFESVQILIDRGYSFFVAMLGEFVPAAGPDILFAVILVPILYQAYQAAVVRGGR